MGIDWRNTVFKVVLLTVAMSPFLSCNSCSDNGVEVINPVDPVAVAAWAGWSPDGERIAVCWGGWPTVRGCGLYLIDTAGWVTRALFIDEAALFSSVAWSASGEWLVFAYKAQIYKIKSNGDSLTQLTFTSRQWDCDWSDSDSLIAYGISIGDSAGVWIMTPDGDRKRFLVKLGFEPTFTRGDSVLFRQNSHGARDSSDLTLVNPADSAAIIVLKWKKGDPYLRYSGASASPEGDRIVLAIEGNVWVVNRDGGNQTVLTQNGGGNPNWSPSGDRITYFKPSVGGGSLWIMNADGSGKMPVPGW